jgi:hypothetical protein
MPCNSTVHAGTTAPETHVIQLGKTSGVVRFLFKSFEIPDAFTLRYQGIDLIPRLCTSTTSHDTTMIPAACNLMTGFCCDGVDQCWKDVRYSGTESSMTVIIEPNCDIPDDRTKWEFLLTCP